MLISLILATIPYNNKEYIGNSKKNDLLIKDREDMNNFVELTSNHFVLMGYNTFLSINSKPLKNRTNLVITSKAKELSQKYSYSNLYFFDDIDNAINFAKMQNETELFVIGGAKIYDQLYPICDKIYLTNNNILLLNNSKDIIKDADITVEFIKDMLYECINVYRKKLNDYATFSVYIKSTLLK